MCTQADSQAPKELVNYWLDTGGKQLVEVPDRLLSLARLVTLMIAKLKALVLALSLSVVVASAAMAASILPCGMKADEAALPGGDARQRYFVG